MPLDPTSTPDSGTRWIQLVLGVVVMMAISSPQYVWTLFTKPLATGAALPSIQITFSILVILQTWLAPGQLLASSVTSILSLYTTYGLFCGLGMGFV